MAIEESAGIKGICRAIGDELRRARERKKVTLEEVSKRTKINPAYLQSIEEGEFGFLPEPYVRAFIRAYAQDVGLEPSTMLRPLDRVRERLQEAKSLVPAEPKREGFSFASLVARLKELLRRPKGSALLFTAIGIAVVGLVAVYALNYKMLFGGREVPAGPAKQRAAASQEMGAGLLLDMELLQETWVQVAADDSTLSAGICPAGERKSWRARHHFVVKAADAGAVLVFLNGMPLGRLGDKGQEVSVRLEREGIVSRTGARSPGQMPAELEQLTVEQYRGGLSRRQL
ncbi:MAG: DUF4115 domain-containing protein [candidate division KSB1 bacterium]|nr:DUF4115 domain-containing protein [candidate division KSB1 bacterium]